ncbi:2572_t:CDS:2, partial [Acaulospora colombiana]
AWTALRGAKAVGGDDKVLDAALLIFAVIAVRSLRHASDLARMEDVVELLCTSMEISPDDDILLPPPEEAEEGDEKTQRFSKSELSWARKLGLSKSDMTNLAMLRTSIQDSQVVLPDQIASHRLLASESLVKVSETGYTLPSTVTQSAVKALVEELSQLSGANEDFKPDRKVGFRHIYNCMRLLEGTNIQKQLSPAPDADELRKDLVINLARYTGLWPNLDESMELALRLLITITSDDVEMSESLSSEPNMIHNLLRLFVRWYKKKFHTTESHSKSKKGKKKRESDIEVDPETEEVPNLLERVSMSLGLVTQLAKQVDSAKQHILETYLPMQRLCTSPPGEAEAQAHFLHGHIGILLAILCTHDSSSRSQVIPYLRPRKASAKDKTRALVEVVREFSSLLSTVVSKANERSSPEDEEYVGEVASDEGVLLAQTMVRKLESLL